MNVNFLLNNLIYVKDVFFSNQKNIYHTLMDWVHLLVNFQTRM